MVSRAGNNPIIRSKKFVGSLYGSTIEKASINGMSFVFRFVIESK